MAQIHLVVGPVGSGKSTLVPTFSMEVPLPFFELASDRWQPVEDDELAARNVRRGRSPSS